MARSCCPLLSSRPRLCPECRWVAPTIQGRRRRTVKGMETGMAMGRPHRLLRPMSRNRPAIRVAARPGTMTLKAIQAAMAIRAVTATTETRAPMATKGAMAIRAGMATRVATATAIPAGMATRAATATATAAIRMPAIHARWAMAIRAMATMAMVEAKAMLADRQCRHRHRRLKRYLLRRRRPTCRQATLARTPRGTRATVTTATADLRVTPTHRRRLRRLRHRPRRK